MFCENCGKEIADNTKFCPHCGHQLNGYNINGYTYTVNTGNTTNTDNATPSKKKKKTWIWILLIVLIVGSLLRNCGKSHDETGSTSKGNTASESVEDYSDKPVWSKEYLFWYIESSDVNMNLSSEVKSAQKILTKVQKFDDAKNLTTESSLFKGSSCSLTTESTGLVYMGGERKNKPDGLGGIWRSYQVGDVTVQKLVYAGYFSKGQYDGNGILFKDYDDSAVQNTFDTISSMYGWNADNAQNYCEEYLESMKKLVSTLNLDKKEWLKYRKGGIGGSDAGAICGLNPYRTAMQVYNDKRTEEIEEFDNEAMREGRDLEEYVARRFMEATGKKVRRANTMFCDEENPFMLADVDRMIVGENAGLECKTASPFSADKWEDDKIPLSYQIQCYHYMSVMRH